MRAASLTHSRRGGLTLVELVIAAGLMSLLMVAVFNLLDNFLTLWDKSENRRQLVEEAAGMVELLAEDLSSIEAGPRGDLLAEWVFHDTDMDGVSESAWPRIRMVRHASPAELSRLQAGRAVKADDEGLIEVIWAVMPANPGSQDADARAEGLLLRGERIYGDQGEGLSFFDEKYLSSTGAPTPGTVSEVGGNVLWLGMEFATQTSILNDGWSVGGKLEDCSASWDAWNKQRPNAERHVWNDPGAGMPGVSDKPLLPRRVRFVLEIERKRDLKRRTRTDRLLTTKETALEVADGERVPDSGFLKIDGEWMEIKAKSGRSLTVRRGARGTKPMQHASGTMIHYGQPLLREVPIALHQEDWNL